MRLSLAGTLLFAACASGDLRIDSERGVMMGGDDIRLEGEGFVGHGPAVIHFGVTSAKAIVIESDRLIRLKTPKMNEPGTVDLVVTFADATTFTLPAAYTFEDRMPGIEIRPKSD